MYPFRERIIIFYKDIEWAIQLYEEINTNAKGYIRYSRGISEGVFRIEFTDDTIAEFYPSDTLARGSIRHTIGFIQEGVSKKCFNEKITPYSMTGIEWIIKDYDELCSFWSRRDAWLYYK